MACTGEQMLRKYFCVAALQYSIRRNKFSLLPEAVGKPCETVPYYLCVHLKICRNRLDNDFHPNLFRRMTVTNPQPRALLQHEWIAYHTKVRHLSYYLHIVQRT